MPLPSVGDWVVRAVPEALDPPWAGAPPLLAAVTAEDDPEAALRIQLAGFRYHFVKPADPLFLLAALARLDD